jgi:hypothetical protein
MYMLLPLVYPDGAHREDRPPWMAPTEKLGCNHLPPDGVFRRDRLPSLPWIESRLKPRSAAMDRIGICRRCCHSSFHNNYNNVIFFAGLNYNPISFFLKNPS